VVQELSVGGAQRHATALTLGLDGRVERIVLCTSGGEHFRPPLVAAGIPIERIPRPKPQPHKLVPAAIALAAVLRRERPHLVHAWNPGAVGAAALARVLARCPDVALIGSYHGVPGRPVARAARVFALTADLVVACGPLPAAELLEAGLPASRVVAINNAVDAVSARSALEVRNEFGLNGDEVVVTVGRYAEEKNQALLIDALAELAPRRPRLRALVVGEGPLEGALRERIAARGLTGIAQVTGPRLDSVDIMAAADVFALSSSSEALPFVVLEAMSVCCPIVATAVGGIPDVVQHERTGLLVAKDDRSGLAAGIERLLDERALARALAANAEQLVEQKFSLETMVERYAAVYESVVAARARRV
jgi:glycosyltransferase involved in cell wall biosynthesis